jgi:hypothetical protein
MEDKVGWSLFQHSHIEGVYNPWGILLTNGAARIPLSIHETIITSAAPIIARRFLIGGKLRCFHLKHHEIGKGKAASQ